MHYMAVYKRRVPKTVHETKQPVFLTKNGFGDIVVMRMRE